MKDTPLGIQPARRLVAIAAVAFASATCSSDKLPGPAQSVGPGGQTGAVSGPAAKLSFKVQPSNATVGAAIAPAVQVAVEDAQGNVVTSSAALITVSIKNGTGTKGAALRGTTSVNAVNGVATFATLSVDSAGTGYVLLAGTSGLQHVASAAFNVSAASVARLSYVVQPTTVVAGVAITPAVQVALVDSFGNIVTSSTAPVTVSIKSGSGTSGAQLLGATSVNAVNGVATFATLGVSLAGTGYVLLAGAPNLFHVASTAFDVTASQSRTYSTSFPLTENPISEGGNWINGGTVGLEWSNVSTTPGLAIGHETGASYTDATALLTGSWGPDQRAQGAVYTVNQNDACYQEVELRLRSALSADVNRGYEISYKMSQSSAAYLIIVRWNGALGDFTFLFNQSGTQYGIKTGDVVSASIVGNVITAYKNGVVMAQVSDGTFTSGAPGMGFNLENAPTGCSGTNGDYGFTSYTATDAVTP